VTVAQPYRLSALEVACGLVFGANPRTRLPTLHPHETPRTTLEDAIRPALEHPPCLVSFSGGRDSSAVLAVATELARREGLAPPIPVTNRFPEAADTDESQWQERVVRHLRVEDWIRLEFDDQLDIVGPIAMRVLERHGLIWPFNAHFHAPMLREAHGGSLLTGAGGDEAFTGSSWPRTVAVLSRRVSPKPRDVLRLGFAVAPQFVRSRVVRRRVRTDILPWLTETARRRLVAAWAAEAASEPVRWRSRYQWWRRVRYLSVAMSSVNLLAADENVRCRHPLADAKFSAALAALPRSGRFVDRTGAMRSLFSDVLPDDVLARPSKTSFDGAFWNRHSQCLAAAWNGEAVDHSLVDVDALRALWSSGEPNACSFTLLQSIWLASGRSARQPETISRTRSAAALIESQP
jgi:asparagine synthetase B (glutamine-hydrolysing)